MELKDRLFPIALSFFLTGASFTGSVLADDDEDEDNHRGRKGTFSFALIGDLPYTDEQVNKLDNLIEDVNAAEVEYVVHVGDIKAGSTLCDDETYLARFNQYQEFDLPFVYTPGDNEWTDCHRVAAGQFHPLERLTHLRQIFFPVPGLTTGGETMQVRTQSVYPDFADYVENVLWVRSNVVFATFHVVGSNNDLAPWSGIDPEDSFEEPREDRLAEFLARQEAALAWLDETFRVAERRQSAGAFLFIHANPRFELSPDDDNRAGFNEFLAALEAKVIEFGRPVVLAHGDSHFLFIDKPLFGPTVDGTSRRLEDFTRIQTFGTDDVHWVRVTVRAAEPNVFLLEQVIVDENRFERLLP